LSQYCVVCLVFSTRATDRPERLVSKMAQYRYVSSGIVLHSTHSLLYFVNVTE